MYEILKYFLKSNSCPHTHALLNSDEGYCPDCGKYLKKYYYVIRCKHCEIKRLGERKRGGEILPVENYCENCGGNEFYIEKLEKINFFDINYAILVKEEIPQPKINENFSQIWVEHPEYSERARYLTNKKIAS